MEFTLPKKRIESEQGLFVDCRPPQEFFLDFMFVLRSVCIDDVCLQVEVLLLWN